jgi:hypothetical protein
MLLHPVAGVGATTRNGKTRRSFGRIDTEAGQDIVAVKLCWTLSNAPGVSNGLCSALPNLATTSLRPDFYPCKRTKNSRE